MSEDNQNQGNVRPKTLLDNPSLRLNADPLANAKEYNGKKRAPALSFSFYTTPKTTEIQIVVNTNAENDKEHGRIKAKLDFPAWQDVLRSVKEAINLQPGQRMPPIKNFARQYDRAQNKSVIKLDTTILIGKDDAGVVYIGVVSWDKDRPVIKFPFRPSQMHQLVHPDGTPATPAEISVRFAPNFIAAVEQAMDYVMKTTYVPIEPFNPSNNQQGGNRGGGGGGGGNYNRGGGGNYNGGGGGGGGNYNRGGSSAGGGDFGGGDDDFPM